MALKDLVAKRSDISEAVIEKIVSGRVRYYSDTYEIGFTPAGGALSHANKVLVYLVALTGWQYVDNDPPIVATKPADLEAALGIHGGTLRPILKNLKDAHLIASGPTGYSVREGNLEAIEAAISGEKKPAMTAKRKGRVNNKEKPESKSARASAGTSVAAYVATWINEGFFNQPQTLNAVHERLHEHGMIVANTAVSTPLLRAVQKKLLRRKKSDDGKWTYCVPGKA